MGHDAIKSTGTARGTAARIEISGLSLAEFCRRAGLAYSTVLGLRREAREAAAPASPEFVVVEALEAEAGPRTGSSRSSVKGEHAARSVGTAVMERGGTELLESVDWRPQAAAVNGAAPPWRVELELPGGLTLQIYGECPDSHQARP